MPAVLLVETIVANVYAPSTKNGFDTRSISPRKYRRHSSYAANDMTASSCRTYVLLQDGLILPIRVVVSTPLFLEKTIQIFESLCSVVLFFRECRMFRIRKSGQ